MRTEQIDRTILYERVWDTPMSKLARAYGLSDVGLKKACVRVGIPTPPRGYWARVRNGQSVRRPPLPPPAPGAPTLIQIYEPRADTPSANRAPKLTRSAPPTVVVPETLHGAHPLIIEAKKALLASYKDGYGRIFSPDGLDIQVTPENLNRALRIMQAVVREGGRLGYGTGTSTQHQRRNEGYVGFEVEGEHVPFALFEKVRREDVPEKERRLSWESRYRFRASGVLVLAAGTSTSSTYRRQWKETDKVRLEDMIGDFLVSIPAEARRQKEERREREEWHRKWEAERAAERGREEAAQRERDRRQHLEAQAEAWTKSQKVRAFVDAAAACAASRSLSREDEQDFDNWVEWARKHADRLDPLTRGLPHLAPEPPLEKWRRIL